MSDVDVIVLDPTPKNGSTKSNRDKWITTVTLLTGAGILKYLYGFNQHTFIGDEYLIVNVMWLMLVPALIIFFLFREEMSDFGFRRAENGVNRISWVFIGLMVVPIIIAGRFPAFKSTYPLRFQASTDWSALLNWELLYGFYLFCWEFFFRGFLLFGLRRSLGDWAAIGITSFGFGVMHIGKPVPEMISSFFGGAILGWLALRGKSFLPCFVIHWAIAILMDLVAIHGRPGGLF